MKKYILILLGGLLFTTLYSQPWDAPTLEATELQNGSVYYVENVGMNLQLASGGWWNTQAVLKTNGLKTTARAKSGGLWVLEFSSANNTLFRDDLNGNVYTDNTRDNQWSIEIKDSETQTYTIQAPSSFGGYKTNEFLGTKGEQENTNNGDAYLVKYNHDEVDYAQYVEWKFLNISLYEARMSLYDALNSASSFPIDISQYEQTYLNSSIVSEIDAAATNLNKDILTYKADIATPESPVEFTSYIVNHSFESGFDGWTNSGMVTQTNNVFNIKEGNTFIEKWVNIGSSVTDGGVEQTIANLPAGLYTLKVAAGNIQQKGSGSTENSGSNPQTGVYAFVSMNNSYFDIEIGDINEYTLDFLKPEGELKIGFKLENATGNWVTCDNFRIEYKGAKGEDISSFVEENINLAELLLDEHFQNDSKQSLQDAITNGQAAVNADPLISEDLIIANINLIEAINNSNISIKAFSTLKDLIDDAVELYGLGEGESASILNDVIVNAQARYINIESTLEELFEESATVEKAMFSYNLANASGTIPTVVTNPNYARGAIAAFGRSTVTGSNIIERGFCWSESSEPTVLDNRTTKTYNHNGTIYHLENLEPGTVYYMRAYAMTGNYAVGYGDVIKFATIPKGNVTYTLEGSVINGGENYPRIKEAMESAIYYINNYTSISGHHLSVSYNAGTPTAEASYGGYLRFGPSANYQRTGTALHEFGHTIGVGQHHMWYGPNSPMRANGSRGDWLGERTSKVVQFFENNNSAKLTGDNVHMWPYGINGAHEDSGSELLYMINSMVHQALGEDGLPPAGGFLLPAYTFDCDSSEKFYIKNVATIRGRDTSFLIENSVGRLSIIEMTPEEALENEYAAWNLIYLSESGLYVIKNVATGKIFTYKSVGTNGVQLVSKESPADNEKFQLLKSDVLTNLGDGKNKYSGYGYWIVHPEHKLNPPALAGALGGNVAANAFNFSTTVEAQRWLLIKEEDMDYLNEVLSPTTKLNNLDNNQTLIYVNNGNLFIRNQDEVFSVDIFDISGNKIKYAKDIGGEYSTTISRGAFIVQVNSKNGTNYKKVIIN